MIIDITGYYKPALLQALVNSAQGQSARPQAMFIVQKITPLSLENAEKIYAKKEWLDYVNGKKMSFFLDESDTTLDLTTYARDNGKAAVNKALKAIDELPKENYVQLKGFQTR